MSEVVVPSIERTLVEALGTFAKCSRLFIDAQDDQRIYFDDKVVSAGLSIIGRLATGASKLNQEAQFDMLLHWVEDGPSLCEEIITQVERRSPPVLHSTDILSIFKKEGDGY